MSFENKFEFFHLSFPEDPVKLKEIVTQISKNPEANVRIEIITKTDRQSTSEMRLQKFLEALRSSKPFGASIKNEIIPAYKSKSGKDENVLEFFVRGVEIDEKEYCLWLSIPDNESNRDKMKKLV